MTYLVTLYNQREGTPRIGKGRTRNEAFRRALINAGEAWLRFGGVDILTSIRVMFYDDMMPRHRTTAHLYMSDPRGFGVEWRKDK